jgi:hypothetical protein
LEFKKGRPVLNYVMKPNRAMLSLGFSEPSQGSFGRAGEPSRFSNRIEEYAADRIRRAVIRNAGEGKKMMDTRSHLQRFYETPEAYNGLVDIAWEAMMSGSFWASKRFWHGNKQVEVKVRADVSDFVFNRGSVVAAAF